MPAEAYCFYVSDGVPILLERPPLSMLKPYLAQDVAQVLQMSIKCVGKMLRG